MEKRGNWSGLKTIYQELESQQVLFDLSHEFQGNHKNGQIGNVGVLFDEKDRFQLSNDIQNLCQKGGDRIVNDLEIQFLQVRENFVELLVISESLDILTKMARLKSRTATLMSFKNPEKFSGNGTWAKGIWISKIDHKQDLAISIIKADSNFLQLWSQL